MAFPYDSDRRFYFQVYIPNIDNVDLNSMPVIAPEMDEDNDCKILGYQLNANGSVSMIELTESYASTHLVWIVSINETVDNNGNQRLGIHKQDTKATHERGFDYKEVFLNKIKISDKKECWLCGRADISFMAVQTNGCGFSFETIITSNCMKKVGNSDLNTWLDVTFHPHNFTFDPLQLPGTDFFEQHQFLHYLIYEEDAKTNANKKNRTWSNQYSTVTLSGTQPIYGPSCSLKQSQTYEYFSKDSPYWTTDTDFPVAYHELPFATSNTIWSNYTSIGSGSGGQFEIISKKAYW